MKVIVRAPSASSHRVAGWIESRACRSAWIWGERCAAIVALSCDRLYSSVVKRPNNVCTAAVRMWRRHYVGERFAKAGVYMPHGSREGFGGEVLDLMMVGVCLMSLLRMSVGMCVGMLAFGIGDVHLACRLVRSRSPYDAEDVVGRVIVNLPGYCERMAGRMWVSLLISSSSNSGIGVVFVSDVILIASSPAGEVGYPSVSRDLS